jgi:hypothetical protein
MKIKFTDTTNLGLEPPKPAKFFIPEWYKNADSYVGNKKLPREDGGTNATIKRCMPVFDAITSGYIIESPADIYVTTKDNERLIQWANYNLIGFHVIEQAPTHPAKGNFPYPKWVNPWAISTPSGYSSLFVQPFHRESDFTILPGIVDTDQYTSPVNFPFVFNDPNFEGVIPKGTPIAQVIPFKRDSWVMELGGKNEIEEHIKITEKISSKFFDRYKTMFWNKKEYK